MRKNGTALTRGTAQLKTITKKMFEILENVILQSERALEKIRR